MVWCGVVDIKSGVFFRMVGTSLFCLASSMQSSCVAVRTNKMCRSSNVATIWQAVHRIHWNVHRQLYPAGAAASWSEAASVG